MKKSFLELNEMYQELYTNINDTLNSILKSNDTTIVYELDQENIVEEIIQDEYQGYKHYHNKLYQTEDDWTSYYVEAKESLQSLIQSLGLDVNKNYLILQKL